MSAEKPGARVKRAGQAPARPAGRRSVIRALCSCYGGVWLA